MNHDIPIKVFYARLFCPTHVDSSLAARLLRNAINTSKIKHQEEAASLIYNQNKINNQDSSVEASDCWFYNDKKRQFQRANVVIWILFTIFQKLITLVT